VHNGTSEPKYRTERLGNEGTLTAAEGKQGGMRKEVSYANHMKGKGAHIFDGWPMGRKKAICPYCFHTSRGGACCCSRWPHEK